MPTARTGLMRSRDQAVLFGVCAGIAESLGWSPNTVRVLYVVGSVASASFPGILVYLLLAFLMPVREA